MVSDLRLLDEAIVCDGNVGIGVNDPQLRLEVEGQIRLKQLKFDVGTWLHQNGIERAFIGMNGDNQVGILGNKGAGWGLVMDITTGYVAIGNGQGYQGNGSGQPTPMRPLHVRGKEIHTEGNSAGFSFSDRNSKNFVETPSKGERWVWYASEGKARLWSGGDRLLIGSDGSLHITGSSDTQVERPKIDFQKPFRYGPPMFIGQGNNSRQDTVLFIKADTGHIGIGTDKPEQRLDIVGNACINGTIVSKSLQVWIQKPSDTNRPPAPGSSGESGNLPPDTNKPPAPGSDGGTSKPIKIIPPGSSKPPTPSSSEKSSEPIKIGGLYIPAFVVDPDTGRTGIGTNKPQKQLDVVGDAQFSGTLTANVIQNTSSRELKENIVELSSEEAIRTLVGLSPVKFSFTQDVQKKTHVGFIAEEVPELLATIDRKTLSPMDIVAVLTRVVQQQQQQISQLLTEFVELKNL
jgi:hypothetical protein